MAVSLKPNPVNNGIGWISKRKGKSRPFNPPASDEFTFYSRDGKISLVCYAFAAIVVGLPDILHYLQLNPYPRGSSEVLFDFLGIVNITRFHLVHTLQFLALNFFIILAFRGFTYQVAVRSTFLGYVFGFGLHTAIRGQPSWTIFGMYLAILATFHYSEFLVIAWTNPSAATIDTFVLQHSLAYSVAACSSWFEFLIEHHFFPWLKYFTPISFAGLAMCIGGEALRKTAIFTAKRNFNHLVQTEKSDDHELVTHGVYGLCRHPSYVGWFYWSIGTQLILQNPFCAVAYALASWRFFHDRVLLEEITLLNFFGPAYVEYQKKVGTGLPFIHGYRINL